MPTGMRTRRGSCAEMLQSHHSRSSAEKNPHSNRAQGTTKEILVQHQRCPCPAATSATAQPRQTRAHRAQSSKHPQAKEQHKPSHRLRGRAENQAIGQPLVSYGRVSQHPISLCNPAFEPEPQGQPYFSENRGKAHREHQPWYHELFCLLFSFAEQKFTSQRFFSAQRAEEFHTNRTANK